MEKTWNTGELTRSALWAKITPKEHWGLIHKVTKESGMTSKEPKASFGSVKVRVHASTIGKRPGKNGLHGRRKPLMTKKITKPGLTYARKNILMRAFHKKKIISTASSCCQGWHSQLLGLWGLQVCDDPPHSTRAHVLSVVLVVGGSSPAVTHSLVQCKSVYVFCPAPFHVDLHSRHIFKPVNPGVLCLQVEQKNLSHQAGSSVTRFKVHVSFSAVSLLFFFLQLWTSSGSQEIFLIWLLSSSCYSKYGKAGRVQVSTGYSFNINATVRFSNVTSSVSLVLIDKKKIWSFKAATSKLPT